MVSKYKSIQKTPDYNKNTNNFCKNKFIFDLSIKKYCQSKKNTQSNNTPKNSPKSKKT